MVQTPTSLKFSKGWMEGLGIATRAPDLGMPKIKPNGKPFRVVYANTAPSPIGMDQTVRVTGLKTVASLSRRII